jgi:hypothetical protein
MLFGQKAIAHGFQVDDQFEFGWVLDGQVSRLGDVLAVVIAGLGKPGPENGHALLVAGERSAMLFGVEGRLLQIDLMSSGSRSTWGELWPPLGTHRAGSSLRIRRNLADRRECTSGPALYCLAQTGRYGVTFHATSSPATDTAGALNGW